MILRYWPHVVAILALFSSYLQGHALEARMKNTEDFLLSLLSKSDRSIQIFCQEKAADTLLYWKEEGEWQEVCPHFIRHNALPRYWKLQLGYKYKLIFGAEIPITVSIVILT